MDKPTKNNIKTYRLITYKTKKPQKNCQQRKHPCLCCFSICMFQPLSANTTPKPKIDQERKERLSTRNPPLNRQAFVAQTSSQFGQQPSIYLDLHPAAFQSSAPRAERWCDLCHQSIHQSLPNCIACVCEQATYKPAGEEQQICVFVST